MIPAFPKILQLGAREASELFDGSVEITEKLDGSQFSFGIVDGHFYARSKGVVIAKDDEMNIPKLFSNSIPLLERFKKLAIQNNLNDVVFSGEFLNGPHHNTLRYKREPVGNFACFATAQKSYGAWLYSSPYLDGPARDALLVLGVDRVPVLHHGDLNPTKEFFDNLLNTDSYLGGEKIEGFVIKNYNKSIMIGATVIPIIACKYVSDAFKERHVKTFVPGMPIAQRIIEEYSSSARYQKSIQWLDEQGKLTNSLKDIGPLIGRIVEDLKEEEADNIKELLFKHYWKTISNGVVKAFPEFYKKKLLDNVLVKEYDEHGHYMEIDNGFRDEKEIVGAVRES